MLNLKLMPIWVVWRYEVVKGKKTKVLYSAKTGNRCGCNSSYSNSWCDYQKAVDAVDTLKMDGIGFVVPDGVAVIDRDHIKDNDSLLMRVHELVKSYTEKSPSGAGEHIICKVDKSKIPNVNGEYDASYYMKNPHNDLELYIGGYTNRYVTFTGNAVRDIPIADCTDGVIAVMEEFMRKDLFNSKKDDVKAGNGEYEFLDDMEVIIKARAGKNGNKFGALYDKGDTSEYGSASEADLALCSILAFYVGGDPDRIDFHYRASKLYRDKWERDDYRNNTIQKAIDGCNGTFYTGKMPCPPFVYTDDKGIRHISCPLLAKYFRENVFMISVRDSGRGGVQRYVYENGVFSPYADEMLKGLIKSFIAEYDERLVRMRDVNEVFQLLITDLNFVTSDMLNIDEGAINFQNGMLNVESFILSDHDPASLSTIQLPCQWTGKPEATPVFDEFLNTLTDGNADEQELLLEFIGATISNVKGWRMKKALFMVGPGDTGKSQLKSLTELLLGKGNFVAIDLGEIEARFGTGNIYGKRLAGSSDMSFMTVDELKTFKKCTGGDSLFAEFKGQNGFEFTYDGLLWFCMNKLPKFGGDDGEWVYNRIMQINCKNVIPPDKQDKKLLDKLYAERGGIIYKSVMALKRLIDRGYQFIEPESVKEARDAYHSENNTVIAFFEDCMIAREGGKIKDQCTTGKVYKVYREWCKDNNHGFAKTAKEFRTELAAYLGVEYKDMIVRRGSGGSYFKDYTLSDEMKENYRKVYGYDDDIAPLLS